jgi:hypothetical protein
MLKDLEFKSPAGSGLNSDLPPWNLPDSFMTDGKNFRLQDGALLSSGSSSLWFDQLGATDIDFFMSIPLVDVDLHIIAGKDGVYSFDGTNHSILQSANATLDRGWTGCMLGGIPVLNNPEVGAFYWFPTAHGQTLTPLPFDNQGKVWNPTSLQKSAKVMRSHRNFLFALDLTEFYQGKTAHMPDAYRWSHPSDINSIPPTWDDQDPNYLAGLAQLGADCGTIVDGLSLRDMFVIYADKGINLLELSGDIYVWNRRQMTTTSGLLAKDCVVEVLGAHYLMTDNDIVRFDGSRVESIMQGRLRKHLQGNMDAINYRNSVVISNLTHKEVWFCIPTNGETWPTLAYIYNWTEDSWGIRELAPNTSFLAYGPITKGSLRWEDLQSQTPPVSWATYSSPWYSQSDRGGVSTVIGTEHQGKIIDVDPVAPNDSLDCFVERTDFPLEGIKAATTITRVYPKIDSSGLVKITIGSQDYPGSPVRWKQPITFDPSKERRINIRSTGILHCWRIESISNSPFKFSGMQIEYTDSGIR